jgi:hypothetical protein
MRLIIWIIIGVCLLTGVSYSGTLSSYPQTKTLLNADRLPAIIGASDTNANINWYDLKELVSKNINWTDVKQFSINNYGGDHTGINWQGFGA